MSWIVASIMVSAGWSRCLRNLEGPRSGIGQRLGGPAEVMTTNSSGTEKHLPRLSIRIAKVVATPERPFELRVVVATLEVR